MGQVPLTFEEQRSARASRRRQLRSKEPATGTATKDRGVGRKSSGRNRTDLIQTVLFFLEASVISLATALAGFTLQAAMLSGLVGALLLIPMGLNAGRLSLRVGADITGILGRMAVGLLLVSYLLDPGPASMTALAMLWASVLVIGTRYLYFGGVRWARGRGRLQQTALIVGAGPTGIALGKTLEERPVFGLSPIGFVDRFEEGDALPHLGTTDELVEIVERTGVQHVIFAFGRAREAELVSLLRRCAELSVVIHTLPRFFELGHNADPRTTEDLWGFPLVRLRSGARVRRPHALKRGFDFAAASVLLVLTLPMLAICAIGVKLTSPGPILFRQTRVGLGGRHFEELKFRTMTVSDDPDPVWHLDNTRVTAWGRFLRPTHLDELPQLFNVLRGDMSLVGARPERPAYVKQFESEIPHYSDRHRLPVGLTGWAQVNGLWGETSIEARVRHDNSYIERWSLWNDILILACTPRMIFGGQARDCPPR